MVLAPLLYASVASRPITCSSALAAPEVKILGIIY